jgi:hypothetical protein
VLFLSVVEHMADGVALYKSFVTIPIGVARNFLERNAIFYNMIHSHLHGPLRNVFSKICQQFIDTVIDKATVAFEFSLLVIRIQCNALFYLRYIG